MTPDFSFGGPLGQAIGLALLHALWQGAIVAGALAALLALMSRRSATARYIVACAALALVFAMAVITGVRSYTARHDEVIAPATSMTSLEGAVLIPATATADAQMSWRDVGTQALDAVRAHIPQIVLIWLVGVMILTLRLAASWTRTRALATRGAVPAEAQWQRVAARLSTALGLHAAVRLVVSGGVEVPSVVGWLQPAILLPVSSFTGLTSEQLEMVLAHELAHIRRHDFLVNAMQSVIETLLFYHPAVWYLSRQIRIERENCCDDLAVSVCGDPVRYARALAQLEELRSTPVLAVAANGGSLLDRVRRLVGARSDRSLFSNGWTAAAAMASFVTLIAVTTAPMLAAKQQTPNPPSTTEVTVKATPQPPAKPSHADEQDEPDDEADMAADVETPEPPEPPEVPDPVVMATPHVHVMPAIAVAPAVTPEAGRDDHSDSNDEEEDSKSNTPPGKLSINDLISLRVQNVTPEYIDQMRSIFGSKVSLREIIGMRVQGVTADYITKMRGIGLGNMTARDIIALKVQGVTPDYLSQIRAAGVTVSNAHDASSLRAMGVTPDFVRSLAAAGYDHLSARDLVRLAASGVNADFIREMSKYKTNK